MCMLQPLAIFLLAYNVCVNGQYDCVQKWAVWELVVSWFVACGRGVKFPYIRLQKSQSILLHHLDTVDLLYNFFGLEFSSGDQNVFRSYSV